MTKKLYQVSKERFATLPQETQAKALDILKAYDAVHVVYEYGKYQVSTGLVILAHYAPDHEFFGTVYADDMYTPDQRRANFKESFGYDAPAKMFQ